MPGVDDTTDRRLRTSGPYGPCPVVRCHSRGMAAASYEGPWSGGRGTGDCRARG
ncbi:CxxxxCH/CxxCH domain-containing protein [Streptomyces sp. NPDC017958]|uniref:CxxxxCH/CxxCH domain-containing protein n=1 Tax=Streptomyces sp. NPDC017958 TaxID=3365021 RepID=UPI0037A9463F